MQKELTPHDQMKHEKKVQGVLNYGSFKQFGSATKQKSIVLFTKIYYFLYNYDRTAQGMILFH